MSAMPIPLTAVMRGTVYRINGPQRMGTIRGEDGLLRVFSFSSVIGDTRLRKRQAVEFEHFDIGMMPGEPPRAVRVRPL